MQEQIWAWGDTQSKEMGWLYLRMAKIEVNKTIFILLRSSDNSSLSREMYLFVK